MFTGGDSHEALDGSTASCPVGGRAARGTPVLDVRAMRGSKAASLALGIGALLVTAGCGMIGGPPPTPVVIVVTAVPPSPVVIVVTATPGAPTPAPATTPTVVA